MDVMKIMAEADSNDDGVIGYRDFVPVATETIQVENGHKRPSTESRAPSITSDSNNLNPPSRPLRSSSSSSCTHPPHILGEVLQFFALVMSPPCPQGSRGYSWDAPKNRDLDRFVGVTPIMSA